MKKMFTFILLVGSGLMLTTMTTVTFAQEGEAQATAPAKGLTITTDGVTTSSDDIDESEADVATEGNMGAAYVCKLNDQQRRIEIDLLNAPSPVPCEVNYYKDTETPGAKTTLWTAQNDAFYCEGQAKSFVEKLESMSWSCSSN